MTLPKPFSYKAVRNVTVKSGCRLFSHGCQGSTVLLFDCIKACSTILNSKLTGSTVIFSLHLFPPPHIALITLLPSHRSHHTPPLTLLPSHSSPHTPTPHTPPLTLLPSHSSPHTPPLTLLPSYSYSSHCYFFLLYFDSLYFKFFGSGTTFGGTDVGWVGPVPTRTLPFSQYTRKWSYRDIFH